MSTTCAKGKKNNLEFLRSHLQSRTARVSCSIPGCRSIADVNAGYRRIAYDRQNYSGYLLSFLNDMLSLEDRTPTVCSAFLKGQFSVWMESIILLVRTRQTKQKKILSTRTANEVEATLGSVTTLLQYSDGS